MDHAAAQPARASSAAPAHSTTTAPARASTVAQAPVAPARPTTVAHTAQPSQPPLAKPADGSTFWTAFSALATLFAALVALCVPFILDWLQRRRRRWHAVAVAQGMFSEAVHAADAAEAAFRQSRRLRTAYADAQRQVAAIRAGNGNGPFITVPEGIAYSSVLQDYTFSDAAVERLAHVARISFDNFRDGRAYLADMEPGWAALLYQKFTDAQHCRSEIERIVEAWGQPIMMRPRDLDAYEDQLQRLVASMRMAGFSLANLANEAVPEHWVPRGAMQGE